MALARLLSVLSFLPLLAVGCGRPATEPLAPAAPSCWGGNLEVCRSECDQNSALSCYDLAWFSEHDQLHDNASQAATLYQKSCDMGYPQACARLGFAYQRGDIVRLNVEQAKVNLQKGCQAGINPACGALSLYEEEVFVARAQRASGTTDTSGQFGGSLTLETPEVPTAPQAPEAPKVETPQAPSVETPQMPNTELPTVPEGPSAPQAPTSPF